MDPASNRTITAQYDYIIIGAGIAGTVLASRLREHDPPLSILLIEAGKDQSEHPLVSSPLAAARLRGSELDWNYSTTPQRHLNNRTFNAAAGKALGGGSVINWGLWTRGDARDYDTWAALAGDSRWSYNGLLPYFQKSENHHSRDVNKEQHGFDGPVSTASATSSGRNYPLRQQVKAAWARLGVEENPDINGGSPLGLCEVVEARVDGSRLIASSVYPLQGVHVMTETVANRILIEERDGIKSATGVVLADSRRYYAQREVIISAGSYRTPQLLLLSGIGPLVELRKHGIKQVVDSPEVGKNLWDHLGFRQYWKLQLPERGASAGSTQWKDPAYTKGNPMEWFAFDTVPATGLGAALVSDKYSANDPMFLFKSPRCHVGTVVQYVGVNPAEPVVPMDGTHITTIVLVKLPTSRGSVTLASANPDTPPVIEFNYYATNADRYTMRKGVQKLLALVGETPEGQEMIASETVANGYEALHPDSTDDEIDKRVRQSSISISHPAGTASMGKVVDSNLRVLGVQCLRVVDASVVPSPIASPIQACIYALAEQAADLIKQSCSTGQRE